MKTGDKKRIHYFLYVMVVGFCCFFQQARGDAPLTPELVEKLRKQCETLQQNLTDTRRQNDQAIKEAVMEAARGSLEQLKEALEKANTAAVGALTNNIQEAMRKFKDAFENPNQWKTQLSPEDRNLVQSMIATMEDISNKVGKSPLEKSLGRLVNTASDIVREPKTMMGAVTFITTCALGLKLANYGVETLRAIWDKPPLVKETNVRTVMDTLMRRPLPKPESFKDLVYNFELQQDLTRILKMTQKARVLNEEYSHFMLFGPPGTGKTAFAKVLAQQSGMKYAIIAGSSFSKFPKEQAILEFERIFEWAEKSKQPIMIVIDEAELALMSREDPTCTDLQRNLVATFLNYVQKPTSKAFLVSLLSNLPHKLDAAVRDRMGEKVEVPLPGLRERRMIFEKYVKKEIVARRAQTLDPKIAADIALEDSKLAQMMQGLSGRAIESAIKHMRRQARFEGSKVLTYELAEKVIKKKVAEEKLASEKYDIQKIKEDALKLNPTPSSSHSSTSAATA